MLHVLTRALRLLRTVQHLRATQIFHQVLYRVWRRPQVPFRAPPPRRSGGMPVYMPAAGATFDDGWTFTFLNHPVRFPSDAIDWHPAQLPKLWRYNLHYLDALQSPELPDDAKAALIESWIAGNPPGAEDAWEPYPLSLRIVNLIKHFQSEGARPPAAHWVDSLAHQVRWLARRLEYHLLANHLFKNAVALVFAGCWFGGADGDAWRRQGARLLSRELREQFLADGGHYERSPMYHAICLVDCLDVLNLLSETEPAPEAETLARVLRDTATRAVAFLRDVTMPDGEIALFNDAAHGIAPPPAGILAYASRVLGTAETTAAFDTCPGAAASGAPATFLVNRPDTGFFGARRGRSGVLIDCGPVGPDYQPGHTHCDTLSFEYVLNGRRLVVDTGTYDYEAGQRRQYARSTCGHNTLMIDGFEQSEIWGVFRVARRARPLSAGLRAVGDGVVFEGTHDGYLRLRGGPLPFRKLSWDGAGTLTVEDKVLGRGRHLLESFVHFHPDLTIVIESGYASVLAEAGLPLARVEFLDNPEVELRDGEYYPAFGIARRNRVLVCRRRGPLPLTLGYRICALVP